MDKFALVPGQLSDLMTRFMGSEAPVVEEAPKPETLPVPEMGGGTVGFYQLPLRVTSTKENKDKVAPINRRVKEEELNQDLIDIATRVQKLNYPMYAEVPFNYKDLQYTARVEPHYRKPGTGGGRPEGWHRGVSLFVRDTKPWIVGVYTRTPFHRPVDIAKDPSAKPRAHLGEDIVVPIGTPVYPMGPGTVAAVERGGSAGLAIYIHHEGGQLMSAYKHMSKADVQPGAQVGFNTVIGLSGDSGNAKGSPHLHYEMRVPKSGQVGSNNPRMFSATEPRDYVGKPIGKTLRKREFVKTMIDTLNKYGKSITLEGRQKKLDRLTTKL